MAEKTTEQTGMPTTGGKKINVFAKAAASATIAGRKADRNETVWQITPLVQPDAPTREQLDNAVTEMHRLSAERKAITTQEDVYKGLLKDFAQEQYINTLVKTGAEPPSPLKVANSSGKTVTFVVQDRSHQAQVSDDQYNQLVDLVGADAAADVTFMAGEFKFDQATMSQPAPGGGTVQDVIAEAIGETLEGLVASGKLTAEQVDGLLAYTNERHFKTNLVDRAIAACGRNAARLASYFEIVSSSLVRYVKV